MIALISAPIVFTVIFMAVTLYSNKKIEISVFLGFSAVCLGVCSLISVGGYHYGMGHAYSNEIWDCKGISIKHETEWTTRESRTETVGSGKNAKTVTKYYTETHGPFWTLKNERGDELSISEGVYNEWKKIWGNEAKVGVNHGSAASIWDSKDGKIFKCEWNGAFDKIMPLSETHRYLNKIRASKYSVLKFKEMSQEFKSKYPRPADSNRFDGVFNYGAGVSVGSDDLTLMRRTNALLGNRYQVHPIYMLFDSKVGIGIVDEIISAWEGTNKNELVIFVGIDSDTKKMSWVKVESWMDDTTINGFLIDRILGKGYNIKILSDTLREIVPSKWHRKQFKDFDYLDVDIAWGWILAAIFCQLVSSFILMVYCSESTPKRNGFRYY